MEEITFSINGVPKRIVVDPKKNLLKVIREELHLTGTKEGCSAGHCGTCAVLVDGEVTLACRIPCSKDQRQTHYNHRGNWHTCESTSPSARLCLERGSPVRFLPPRHDYQG